MQDITKQTTNKISGIGKMFQNQRLQKLAIGFFTVLLAYCIIAGDFNLSSSENVKSFFYWSGYERFISNSTEEENTAESKRINAIKTLEALNRMDYFFTSLEKARNAIEKNYSERDYILGEFLTDIRKYNFSLTQDQAAWLLLKVNIDDTAAFKNAVREELNKLVNRELSGEDAFKIVSESKTSFLGKYWNKEMRQIGDGLLKTVLEPSNMDSTPKSPLIGKAMYLGGLGVILLLLLGLVLLFMNTFCKEVLKHRRDLMLISSAVLITLLIARIVSEYSLLVIPVFIATMLVAILLHLNLALIINVIMTILVSFMVGEDLRFIIMSLISGTFSVFFVAQNGHRSKLAIVGTLIGVTNALVIAILDSVNGVALDQMANHALLGFLNGIVSMILTIGILPFIESVFNVITPVKLLELMNPNQQLLKRLLFEAPGTYHHSLMVANLSESAAEAINANAMLARVGSYYHDIGKLKRPNFFMENQLHDNPHDRMTPSLSTLVIVSHTADGLELAKQYKIPLAIQTFIAEHHGTTLCKYFYHRAKNGEKGELVTEESFRYPGPKPSSKESAVVMLADSVEAAVRSMPDKTDGKMEGMIRKIIQEKLEDQQLNGCELTLKDLDSIARSFTKVFEGYYHERESYPEVKRPSIPVVVNVEQDKPINDPQREASKLENTG